MISREYQCIFVHIPKCAGTSIERALGMHRDGIVRGSQDHRRLATLEKCIWPPARGTFGPLEFAHYVKQRVIAKQRRYPVPTLSEWRSFFKFSVVRNPWDRVFSWYRNVVRDPIHRKNFKIDDSCTFEEFAELHLDCWALDPQLDWLKDSEGRIAVDYVGLFEDLEDTYLNIRKTLGIADTGLPNLLQSKSADFRENYSDALRQRVADKYAEEIDMFGYTYD